MPGICGNSEWGPWGSGMFTLCFQDLILGGLQLLFIIVFGAHRLISISPKPALPDSVPWSTLRKAKIGLTWVMFMLQGFSIVLEFTTERGEWFAPTSDIYLTITWAIFTYLITQEMKRGLKHGWQLRTFLMFSTVYWAFKIISLYEQLDGVKDASYVTWIPSCLIIYPLTILCVWFNNPDAAAYDKMMGEEMKEALGEGEEEKKELDDDIEQEDFRDEQNPEERANFFSRLTFWWVGALVALGYTRPLKDEDIYKTSQSDRVEGNYNVLAENWREEQKRPRPYLARAVFWSFWPTLLFSGICKLCADLLNLATPILLSKIIAFVQYSNEPLHVGILYACGMFLTQSLHVFFAAHHFFNCMRGGYRCRTSMVALVYEKSLHLSNSARQASTVGEIVNHQAIDAQRFQQVAPHVHLTWAAPMSIAISIYLLWQELGAAAMAGLLLMLLLIPLNTTLARKSAGNQKILLKKRDNRMRLMNEVLSGVRLIKFFAWEGSFADKVREVRNEELKNLFVAVYLKAVTVVIWYVTPVLVAAASFTAYALMGNTLTAESAFASVAVFNILRQPLAQFPNVVSGFMEAQVSIARLEKFFASEELDPDAVSSDSIPEDSDVAVRVTRGAFKWGSAESVTLKDINITVKKGQLIAVVGSIGSGKSSFISALIGEIPKLEGSVEVRGTIALVPQQPWIKHTSLKDNILFYRKFDSARYYNTIDVCELERDVAVLPSGDLTEIGERGINLSGGQKARVSLARAVYQDADIYLLDSPLAAVDAHVGKSIFEHCIMGELRTKTRILVTHQLDLLSSADQIVVLKDGNIVDHGDFTTLMSTSEEFSRLIKTHVEVPEEGNNQEGAKKKKKEKGNGGQGGAGGERKIMTKEHQEEGGVNRMIYTTYFKASGGVAMFVILLFCFGFDTTGRVLSDWWLSYWSDQGEAGEKKNTFYLSIYLSALAFSILFVMIKTVLVARGALKAAKTLHDVMLVHVLHAPMSFFDTTPLGRILNRFSKDQNAIDESLSQSMLTMLNQTFLAAGVFITIGLVSPLFISLLLPIVYAFLFAQSYYLRTSRELQRLDSITKSPIFAQFSETLTGLSTIRSTKSGPRFVAENNQKIDANTRMMHNIQAVNRWLAIRMEMLCAVIVSLSSFFAVMERGSVDPGTAGLSIAYSLTLTQTLNQLVRQSTEVETQLVSVERVMEYSTLNQEGPYENEAEKPEPSWPSRGEIEINDLQLRYRPGLDLVLKNITCSIRPKEKVGICGRTGAGKSSFTLALFRMVEPVGGSIKIDGVDISKIGLYDLRSHLSIIPQDPTLFAGTIRSNLDPFENCEDKLLWDVLEQVYLKNFVQGLQNGLNTPVVEGGDNLSVGQRQLMCLGRALLRNSAVLVLDEATAAVDMETDKLIQKTIRERFKDRTVLTIAHRINTIIDCDRVMVLDHGKILEFDSPQTLLSNPNSAFTGLVNETRSLA